MCIRDSTTGCVAHPVSTKNIFWHLDSHRVDKKDRKALWILEDFEIQANAEDNWICEDTYRPETYLEETRQDYEKNFGNKKIKKTNEKIWPTQIETQIIYKEEMDNVAWSGKTSYGEKTKDEIYERLKFTLTFLDRVC